MKKLSTEEEAKLMIFIKDWLKIHGYTQKDLANKLNINSSRAPEIKNKLQDLYKKGGLFNIAKHLIKIEQSWLNINAPISEDKKDQEPFNQLDINYKVDIDTIDGLMDRMDLDYSK